MTEQASIPDTNHGDDATHATPLDDLTNVAGAAAAPQARRQTKAQREQAIRSHSVHHRPSRGSAPAEG